MPAAVLDHVRYVDAAPDPEQLSARTTPKVSEEMMVDLEFLDISDVLAIPHSTPGKFGSSRRVLHTYATIQPWLRQLSVARLDGNLKVYRAGTDIRIPPPYNPE